MGETPTDWPSTFTFEPAGVTVMLIRHGPLPTTGSPPATAPPGSSGSSLPAPGAWEPVEPAASSEPALPELGAALPEAGAALPEAGAALPEAGAALSGAGVALPEAGAALPEAGAALPEAGAALPRVAVGGFGAGSRVPTVGAGSSGFGSSGDRLPS